MKTINIFFTGLQLIDIKSVRNISYDVLP